MDTRDFINSKLRTAKVAYSDTDVRRLEAAFKAASIYETVGEADAVVASSILDRAIDRMAATTSSSCPRCKGGMTNVKFKTRSAGNYCTACRVATLA